MVDGVRRRNTQIDTHSMTTRVRDMVTDSYGRIMIQNRGANTDEEARSRTSNICNMYTIEDGKMPI